jgi:hypothetical protein
MMKPRLTLIALALCATSSWAQPSPPSAAAKPSASCPHADAMDHRQLQGTWLAQIQGRTPDTVLRLGPHPEFSESVRGTLQRGKTSAQVAGDVDAGTFTLEESDDGTRISASWTGQVVAGSCGKEIQGTWTPTETPERKSPFVMRKQGGWQ